MYLFSMVASILLRAAVASASFTTLVALLLVTVALYRLSLHPLRYVPGPVLAAISNIWHAHHAKSGHMFRLGKDLHRRYGPVVRIGPNEVWVNSKEGFKAIYGVVHIQA